MENQIVDAQDVGSLSDALAATAEPKIYYHYDLYGRYSHRSNKPSDRCTEVRPPAFSPEYNWNDVAWVYVPDVLLHPIGEHALPPVLQNPK